MDSSILTSVKKILGIAEEDTSFDDVIIMHINSVLSILCQLGVGPELGFMIEDDGAVWSDFLGDSAKYMMVLNYVGLKVRMAFDPPQGSAVAEAINKNISELEWRINVRAES